MSVFLFVIYYLLYKSYRYFKRERTRQRQSMISMDPLAANSLPNFNNISEGNTMSLRPGNLPQIPTNFDNRDVKLDKSSCTSNSFHTLREREICSGRYRKRSVSNLDLKESRGEQHYSPVKSVLSEKHQKLTKNQSDASSLTYATKIIPSKAEENIGIGSFRTVTLENQNCLKNFEELDRPIPKPIKTVTTGMFKHHSIRLLKNKEKQQEKLKNSESQMYDQVKISRKKSIKSSFKFKNRKKSFAKRTESTKMANFTSGSFQKIEKKKSKSTFHLNYSQSLSKNSTNHPPKLMKEKQRESKRIYRNLTFHNNKNPQIYGKHCLTNKLSDSSRQVFLNSRSITNLQDLQEHSSHENTCTLNVYQNCPTPNFDDADFNNSLSDQKRLSRKLTDLKNTIRDQKINLDEQYQQIDRMLASIKSKKSNAETKSK